MAIFTQGNNSCYFIHIPRTGGRYVSSLFQNSDDMECEYHKIHTLRINNIDVTHLHYPLYTQYFDVNSIPHITVVRNPFDKFVSSIKSMNSSHRIDYNNIITDENSFLKFIDCEIKNNSYHNNWFLPQHKFISPKTHYWKYEWGFGDNFLKWVFNKTKIKLKLQEVNYKKFEWEIKNEYELNPKIKKYIKKFYKKDYQTFKYFMNLIF
jgi:hypothetical protein